MKRLALTIALCATAACGDGDVTDTDVHGPFTGEVRRFVVTGYRLPTNNTEARALADDLDGDGAPDNQAGMVMGLMASQGNDNRHIADMVAAGTLASFLEIQADDPRNDDTVGVTWFATPDAPPVTVGGRLVDGVFLSNRTRTTRAPVTADLRIPVAADADPMAVAVAGFEIDIAADTTEAILRGGVAATDIDGAIGAPILQMLASNPTDHVPFAQLLDTMPHDGTVTLTEIAKNPLMRSLLAPDVELFDVASLSLGIAVRLTPCPSGNCALAAPAAPCFDRVLDGDETDVDCGGSCPLACAAGRTCAAGADCQTTTCEAGGTCTAATCSDGIVDGFESDIDCGGVICALCVQGKQCDRDGDCASDVCLGGTCR